MARDGKNDVIRRRLPEGSAGVVMSWEGRVEMVIDLNEEKMER